MKHIVAITGGIGAGKSVVCRMLRALGYPVYDCDIEAKILMDHDSGIKARIAAEISPEAIDNDGKICRPSLSACVFSNPDKLLILNNIVHSAVRRHFSEWADKQKAATIFVETAILYESGMDKLVNEVWEVTAPKDTRIQRVMERSNLKREEVERRIAVQSSASRPEHKIIINDGTRSVIPQIIRLLHNEHSNS